MKVLGDPSPGSPLIPEILYSFFQMEFACVTIGILVGGFAGTYAPDSMLLCIECMLERGRLLPAMVFSFVWMSLVYCPLAYWAWGTNGWAFSWGVLDFAGNMRCLILRLSLTISSGGGPVEIGSGVSGLALAWVIGRRQEKELLNFRPHNVSLVSLGTFLLWFGWLGFNGGSAL